MSGDERLRFSVPKRVEEQRRLSTRKSSTNARTSLLGRPGARPADMVIRPVVKLSSEAVWSWPRADRSARGLGSRVHGTGRSSPNGPRGADPPPAPTWPSHDSPSTRLESHLGWMSWVRQPGLPGSGSLTEGVIRQLRYAFDCWEVRSEHEPPGLHPVLPGRAAGPATYVVDDLVDLLGRRAGFVG